MKKVMNILFVMGFGWLGWVLGEKISFMTAYFMSGFASILGFYLSWKIMKQLDS